MSGASAERLDDREGLILSCELAVRASVHEFSAPLLAPSRHRRICVDKGGRANVAAVKAK